MNDLYWYLIIILIHEIGHYMSYKYYGITPKIKLKWWGIEIGSKKDLTLLTSKEIGIVALSGILLGATLLFFVNVKWLYIFLCGIDLLVLWNVYSFRNLGGKSHAENIILFYKNEIREWENEF